MEEKSIDGVKRFFKINKPDGIGKQSEDHQFLYSNKQVRHFFIATCLAEMDQTGGIDIKASNLS